MVDAGIARKVDFGEGRFRFEHSYRHPRHFHLICKTCNQSSEFLSSDIEALIEEVASARNFAARQSVLQIYGECEDCRIGRRGAPIDGATTELLFARDALRIAIATERSGLEFYTRASAITRDARGRAVFQKLAEEEKEHLGTLESALPAAARARPAARIAADVPLFQGRGQRAVLGGRRAADARRQRPAGLLIGIRCERGSHRFFKRYGERFEDSEGKQIFLEFADEERAASRSADPRVQGAREAAGTRSATDSPPGARRAAPLRRAPAARRLA